MDNIELSLQKSGMAISSEEKDKENVQKSNNKDKDGGCPLPRRVMKKIAYCLNLSSEVIFGKPR